MGRKPKGLWSNHTTVLLCGQLVPLLVGAGPQQILCWYEFDQISQLLAPSAPYEPPPHISDAGKHLSLTQANLHAADHLIK